MLTLLLELSRYCCQIDFLRYAGAVLLQLLIVPLLLGALLMMSATGQAISCAAANTEIIAPYVSHAIKLDAAHPAAEWQTARPVSFCSDWQGENPTQSERRKCACCGRATPCICATSAATGSFTYSMMPMPMADAIIFGIATWPRLSCSPILRASAIIKSSRSVRMACGSISTYSGM